MTGDAARGAAGRIFIGTSGWSYPHWRGRFYPAELPVAAQLAYLSRRLGTVEINGTFYSLGRPETFARWRAQVPPHFVFALKGSRYLTHLLKLRDCAAPLANFFAQGVLLLGAQLGPVLWQLPPQLPFHPERARAFLAALPRDLAAAERLARHHDRRLKGRAVVLAPDGRHRVLRHALEVRHPSWLCAEALELLRGWGVALVAAETAGRYPLSLERTARDFAYARLHGARALYAGRYRDRELEDWAARIQFWRGGGADVYVYLDNDAQAHAPFDALRLAARCAGQPEQAPPRPEAVPP